MGRDHSSGLHSCYSTNSADELCLKLSLNIIDGQLWSNQNTMMKTEPV